MILQPRRDPRRIQIAEHHREIAALAGGFYLERKFGDFTNSGTLAASGGSLTLSAITSNAGLIEGTTSQGLVIDGAVTNSKTIEAAGTGATVTIATTITGTSAGSSSLRRLGHRSNSTTRPSWAASCRPRIQCGDRDGRRQHEQRAQRRHHCVRLENTLLSVSLWRAKLIPESPWED
jgi:hypothetical protein